MSEMIFPQATNFSEILHSLRRSGLSISNRLRSIEEDSAFVCRVADTYGLPLVANERCGSWYIPPERKGASAYFKSTDGHTSQWSFSLRRLNTQILETVAEHNGCIIVDSTRRGKRMPDALSKTVPIWCSVFNRVLFPDALEAHELFTPPQAVSRSEHSQIEARLNNFAAQLRELNLPIDSIRSKLSKPLRPVWVTPDSTPPSHLPTFPGFHTIVLCTASRRVPGGEISEHGYVQGAGDDSEGWAKGLTASLYWAHRETLLQTAEADLPTVIAEILVSTTSSESSGQAILIKPTTTLYLGSSSVEGVETVIHISQQEDTALKSKYLHLKCTSGKLGSRDLRKELPKIDGFLRSQTELKSLFIACDTRTDLSAGVALAILCKYTDDGGTIDIRSPRTKIDKNLIKQRLSWIMTSMPSASPSRATLQSVNAFLMSEPNATLPNTTVQTPSLTTPEPSPVRLLFESLSGAWNMQRNINSILETSPSGVFEGTATFNSCTPSDTAFTEQYVYAEEGNFTTTAGLVFSAKRRYIWRYAVDTDEMTVWFAHESTNDPEGLFHTVQFDSSTLPGGSKDDAIATRASRSLKAKGHHLCEPDTYFVTYDFVTIGGSLDHFTIKYDVTGPRKDYVSQTEYKKA